LNTLRACIVPDLKALDTILGWVADIFELTPKTIISSSKEPARVKARSVAAYWAVKHSKMKGTEVGRRLSLIQSAVNRAVRRGEQIVDEMAMTLLD
jgi:chromosomal replication initiation ATPase DnaA